MFDTLSTQIGGCVVVAVCVFAFLKGDEPERLIAGAYILGWFASLLIQDNQNLYRVQWGVFSIDVIMLIVIGSTVWRARRTWPVWAAACQLLAVMSHVVAIIDVRPALANFICVINLAGYGVLAAIAIGTFKTWRERISAGLE